MFLREMKTETTIDFELSQRPCSVLNCFRCGCVCFILQSFQCLDFIEQWMYIHLTSIKQTHAHTIRRLFLILGDLFELILIRVLSFSDPQINEIAMTVQSTNYNPNK